MSVDREELRRKYEALEKYLNDHDVYTSEDGEALFMDDDSSFYLEEVHEPGEPKSVWRLVW